MIRGLLAAVFFIGACALLAAPSQARDLVGIRLWHGVEGWNGVELERLVVRFNASQKEYRVVTEYTGDAQGAARDSREGGAAALVLPLQASAALYYNRDAFRRAQLDPAAPPRTWYEMAPVLEALRGAGARCGYTAAAPAELLLDQIGGHDAGRLALDSARVRWVAMLATWQKVGYFSRARDAEEAERRFASGECALLTAPSSRQADLRASAGFDLGVAPLPGYDDAGPSKAARGAVGIWLLPGRTVDEYQGVQRLLAFIAQPQVQAAWRKRTGYASLAPASYDVAAVREAFERELEAAWSGAKSPIDALSAAIERGNALMSAGSEPRAGATAARP
jgi:ABC-type glycerol-3-phosphate transport system substrate-binding protein